MGICVAQYRVAIGSFLPRSKKKRKKNEKITQIKNIPYLLNCLTFLLFLSGDVEKNPGPRWVCTFF